MKLIIIDRDGVINEDSDAYIKSPEEWVPIEGSLGAIARLNRAGYTVTVATNQSGLSRGYFDLNTLSAIHRKMDAMLAEQGGNIDAVFYCPHGPKDKCDCRKPKPGLLNEISKRFQVSLDNVYFVGDSLKDIQASIAANARPMLVKTGKGEQTRKLLKVNGFSKVPVYTNLAKAVDAILENN